MPPRPTPASQQGQALPPQALPRKNETTIRCPNEWLTACIASAFCCSIVFG